MRTRIAKIAVVGFFLSLGTPAHAVLMDFGASGEFFFDTETSLYWWDPAEFEGTSKADIDAFVAGSSIFKYATHFEVDDLLGKSSEGGVPLTDVMGPHQLQTLIFIPGGPNLTGSRWVGFYDGVCPVPECPGTPAPDGWLAQTVLSNGGAPISDVSTIGGTGFQGSVDTRTRGAWINSTVNPLAVPEPTTILLLSLGLAGLGFARRRLH